MNIINTEVNLCTIMFSFKESSAEWSCFTHTGGKFD